MLNCKMTLRAKNIATGKSEKENNNNNNNNNKPSSIKENTSHHLENISIFSSVES